MSTNDATAFSVLEVQKLQDALNKKAAAEGREAPSLASMLAPAQQTPPMQQMMPPTQQTPPMQQMMPPTQQMPPAPQQDPNLPNGRYAPPKIPGQRFVAIIIDGVVVEGLMATERMCMALQSDPVIVDVADRAWLPEVGDYYKNGDFYYNASATTVNQGE